MANAHKGEIRIDLDGQSYTLALSLNAMVEVEALFGLSFEEVMVATTKGSVTHLRACIWALFRKHHPTLTIDQVGALVEGTDLGRLKGLFTQVVTASGPDPKDVPKKANPTSAPPVAAGTGASSTSPRGESA